MKNILFSTIVLFGLSSNNNAQSLDTSFGNNGTVTHVNLGSWLEATELPDGNVILSGDRYMDNGNVSHAMMVKMKPDGNIDTSFGSGGTYSIDQFSSSDYYETFSKVNVLPNGKLLFMYGAELESDIDPEIWTIKIIRLNANGTVDNTFVSYSQQNIPEEDAPYGLIPLPSGKFLIYGGNYIMRFNENGTLDNTYANNGTRIISFDMEEMNIIGNALYLYDYSGRRLVKLDNESSSNTTTYNLPQNSSFYFHNNNIYIHDTTDSFSKIRKLDSNFNPSANYGVNGTATFNRYIGYDFIFQPMGSILAQNYNSSGSSTDKEIIRINPDGSMDTTFGNAGIYTINTPAEAPYEYWSDDYAHSNGKLYHMYYDKNNEISNATIYLKRSNLPDEILAVSDNSMAKDIRITQNPVHQNLMLSGSLKNATIYDMSGKNTGISFEGKQTSVEHLKTGTYMINGVTDSGKKINLKFIKK